MAALFAVGAAAAHAEPAPQGRVQHVVDGVIRPLMAKDKIPGMAVGVVVDGKSYVFNYGLASKQSNQSVSDATLFELGSVSKTFTATLASFAALNGDLSLSDPVSTYLPQLRGTKFGAVPLLDLGTHTPGGLPLQVPDNVRNDDQLIRYYAQWKPTAPPGALRTYSNLSIGTLGLITAKSMHQNFATLMESRLFPALGLHHAYINVPPGEMRDYAWGYTKDGSPIRMGPGELRQEAYGVRTTARDMVRFIEANMQLVPLDAKLQRAIIDTHTGYYVADVLTQDLIWEQYRYPVALNTLEEGNSPEMIFNATAARKLTPPETPREDVWLNKTGSTNGFGTYVAFVPEKHLGIVILANKNYRIADRVSAAYQIVTALSTLSS